MPVANLHAYANPNGLTLMLQMRGILHALERHSHTLQRAGDLPLLIKQLQDWVAKNSDAWGNAPGGADGGDKTMSLAAMTAAAGGGQ